MTSADLFRAHPATLPLALIALFLAPSAALAQSTLKVPQDFGTIQAAIDAAQEGDVILIGPGTYTEAISIDGRSDLELRGRKAILQGGDGPQQTSADDDTDETVLSITSSTNISLSKLRFTNFAGDAIYAAQVTGLTLTACRFEDSFGDDGVFIEDSSNVLITRCRFQDLGDDGIEASTTTDITIEKSRFDTVDEDAIEINDSVGVLIERNRMRNSGEDGIRISSDELAEVTEDVVVMRNKIQDCGDDGIDAAVINGVFERNSIKNVGEDGIDFDSGSANNDVIRNKLNGVEDEGITIEGTGFLVERNAVKNVDSIAIEACGSDHVFDHNRVRNGGSIGILLEPDLDVIVDGATQGNHVLTFNRVANVDSDGIRIEAGADGCTLESNVVGKALVDSYDVESTGNTLLKNTSRSPGQHGFHLKAGGNTITENKAKNSTEFGIQDTTGAGNTYSDNNFDSENIADT